MARLNTQHCMTYYNTLMAPKAPAQSSWQCNMSPLNYRALAPRIWEHANPCGWIDFDINTSRDLP